MSRSKCFILWFDEIGIVDIPLVGGKNASLGEMYRELSKQKVKVPNGFAITATAYRYLLEKGGIKKQIKDCLKTLNIKDMRNLSEHGKKVREIIRNCPFPENLRKQIVDAYYKLSKEYKSQNVDVAVRSSATAEDLPDASFAGQQETFLNIQGEEQLIDACKDCFASLFTNRAIVYREEKKFDHFKVALSIGVQKMVRSDKACSGVLFTLDTETGFKDVVFVTASWGLGENIVQGAVNPDEFFVFKPTLKKGYPAIIAKRIGEKAVKRIYAETGMNPTKDVPVEKKDRERFCLTNNEVLQLAKWGCIIEDHYSKKKGHWSPMDIEWAKDGQTNELFIVQARPETVQSQKDRNVIEEYQLLEKGKVLTTGKSVGDKIGQGVANIIRDVKDISLFKPGQVLVTEMTDPDWVPIMRIASAIVTNQGGRTCFSSDTILLTNHGFKSFKEICETDYEELCVPSLNEKTLKIEWKRIVAVMKRQAPLIEVSVSQSGRGVTNKLKMTADHRIVTFDERKIIGKEVKDVIVENKKGLIAQRIPALEESTERERMFAYFLGALSTDGHVYLKDNHGEVQFIQKPTEAKKEFIETMQKCAKNFFNKDFKVCPKNTSNGEIRGRLVKGNANAYRLYGKQIAEQVNSEQEQLVETLLKADECFIIHFLAGVIDGDGTYNHKANRISIYCDKDLIQPVIVSCLRLGIVPQVVDNRTIYNVQIVEKGGELLQYTKRVKGNFNRTKFGTRFFDAKQILGDIADKVNYKGQVKLCVNKNLLIDAKKIKEHILPLCNDNVKQELNRIINSDTRMQRMSFAGEIGVHDVYNITVADNHNYVVFTEKYTPVIVKNCHAAIVSRELGVPCIVGTNNATEVVKTGQKITVDCAAGEEGKVYDSLLKFRVNRINIAKLKKPKTKVMMNVGNPDEAFSLSFLPNEGVGLAREEFIINSYIKIHPMALLHHNKMPLDVKKQIDELTKGYKDKTEFFIDKLAQGVATIGAAFYPHDVIVRMSDFKSNEYANLIGGHQFEPKEENPMIGWRGASRYYKSGYKDGFALECKAMKRVREVLGLTNVKLMIPMCRTIDEGKKVLAVMAENGLKRGKNGLEVYVMCEVPSNVILAEEFSNIFDGFSIGSNDLTQLTLGIDRDSALVADVFDERNAAVKWMIQHVISIAKKRKRKIGICGDAPSTYPEFAEFLVKCGIDSISLSPDAVVRTTVVIANAEKKH